MAPPPDLGNELARGVSEVRELILSNDPGVAVHFALDLILAHASGVGQLANTGKCFAPIGHLAYVRRKANLLIDGNEDTPKSKITGQQNKPGTHR